MTIASAISNRVYRIGDSGAVVQQIQKALAQIGYQLSGTGYFGPATDTAVEAFQRRAGLDVDGEVGTATARAIDAALAAPRPASNAPSNPEIDRPLWLEAGIRLINTKEIPGARNNPVIIDWAKEEGGAIARDYKADSVPWCALFANHCLTSAGIKGTGTLWALDFAGKWPSVKLIGPAVGAFAPMVRSGGGHIMMVVGRDQHGNIMGLGGNQSDQVSIIPFPTTRLNRGFWWPKGIALPARIGFNQLPVVRSDGKVSINEA